MNDPIPLSGRYFVFGFPLSGASWDRFGVETLLPGGASGAFGDLSYEIRKLADAVHKDPACKAGEIPATQAEILLALRTVNQALRWVTRQYFTSDNPGGLMRCRQWAEQRLGADAVENLFSTFVGLFPPVAVKPGGKKPAEFLATGNDEMSGPDLASLEMILLFMNVTNPAARPAEHLFHDGELRRRASFLPFVTGLEEYLEEFEPHGSLGTSLFHLLRAPMLASPDSLSGQIAYIRDHWSHLLPDELVRSLQFALDVLKEIDAHRLAAYGPPPVLEFGPGTPGWLGEYPEPEAFSRDADWMANVVLMAKSVYVWLDQLSRWYGRPIRTLADIPDEELDRLARWGVNGLWLIGLWERSTASRTIKQWMGNPEAAASAYSLKEYAIAWDLGGEDAWRNLSERAGRRGIKLASDMVPNHMGIDSRWVDEHPEYFLQLEHPPYPGYKFTCENLSHTPGVGVRIEDGYWSHRDAAVVFQRVDERTGHARYIYHGNDGTSMPWNDTAQLNFLLPEVREAVTRVILDVARRFPIIRFDAAMTLAKKHYQRLWFPLPGDAGAIPSRAEHGMTREEFDRAFPVEFWREVVDRVAAEAPDTLLLAEAFWLMEGYFVRTLGMHRVYNSAFMNMLKMEDNQKYRQTLKNVLEFSPGILQRFVNFMNNPDERTAVEQFGRGDKYFGCMVLMVTLPGLPMIGHGQIEGFTEKYGMEYRKAYWDEQIDQDMVRRHEREIFPLMRRRHLFSGAENFALFDFEHDQGWVDENVFAYANGQGDQRVLIIYNNAYESTSGRIRLSSAINRGSADDPSLRQVSIAEALALDCSPGVWYALFDHADGLQYLRTGRDLCEHGLHTTLHGYQYRAFLGIRRLEGGDGEWAGLAASLQGGGAPDLQRARLRRALEPQLAEVRRWMAPEVLAWIECRAVAAGGEADGRPSGVKPLPAVGEADGRPSGVKPAKADSADDGTSGGKSDDAEDSVLGVLPASLRELALRLRRVMEQPIPEKLGKGSQKELAALREAIPHSRALQVVYLAGVLAEAVSPEHGLADEARSLVGEDMDAALREWLGHDHAARMAGWAARLLAASPEAAVGMAAGKTSWMTSVVERPEAGSFLGINEHAGVTWFSAENLDDWLLIVGVAALAGEAPADVVPLLDARSLLRQAAKKAEYRLKEFRKLVG
ncbi:MAG: alpha-amylase family glycosyl hydrolase [Candidatus Krumholzibacteriia bacterium]